MQSLLRIRNRFLFNDRPTFCGARPSRRVARALAAPLAIWLTAGVAASAPAAPALRAVPIRLAPVPADPSTIAAQLSRYRGQTRFLNPLPTYETMPLPGQKPGDARAVQEADVFKLGKPGLKLLYLLNGYRGLQVVSFADGADSPRLVGRAEPTGHTANQMYYDAESDHVITLEQDYQAGVLQVYSVADPARPTSVFRATVQGFIADSRLVGDVLYVATRAAGGAGAASNATGWVYSFRVRGADGFKLVSKLGLSRPISSGENMNIIEMPTAGGGRAYFLVAVLSESGSDWRDTRNSIQVIDVSDPKGKIVPRMLVQARGTVRERAQTHIKNQTLMVVSNYRNGTTDRDPLRIAVETFKLPTTDAEVLSKSEGEFRQARIEHELAGLSGDAREKKFRELIADAALGLQGRFVATDEPAAGLKKLVPDAWVTVGDTSGLHANLRDVRFSGDRLYAFWVPQNQIDPFDLFDISQPEKDVKYLGRLHFDGWIERAQPIGFQGREFVLGLGYILPSEGNESQRRYPQAMLFEIKPNAQGKPQAQEIGQITLASQELWVDYNSPDRYIEVRDHGDGTGSLLFQVYGFASSGQSAGETIQGGKLLGFNLTAAQPFTEGALLAGEGGWVRRIFSNPELSRIHAFSDEALGTFATQGIGQAGAIEKAVSVLELARNVQAYASVGTGGAAPGAQGVFGVQVISDGWWSFNENAVTQLRLVRAEEADAEKDRVRSIERLMGNFVSSLEDRRDGTLWVVTSSVAPSAPGREQTTRMRLFHVGVEPATGEWVRLGQAEWRAPNRRSVWMRGVGAQIVQLPDGEIIVNSEQKLRRIVADESAGFVLHELAQTGCAAEDSIQLKLRLIGGRGYLEYAQVLTDPSSDQLAYARRFAAPVELGATTAKCDAAVNIPGSLLDVVASKTWVTDDQRLVDVVWKEVNDPEGNPISTPTVFTEGALESLTFDTSATLVDDYLTGSDYGPAFQRIGDAKWGYFGAGGDQIPYSAQVGRFVTLGLDAQARFTHDTFFLNTSIGAGARLEKVIPLDSAYLGVFSNGSQVQTWRWTASDPRPTLVKLRPVNVRFELAPPEQAVAMSTLPGWSWLAAENAVHFTAANRSLEFARGYLGVTQFVLAE